MTNLELKIRNFFPSGDGPGAWRSRASGIAALAVFLLICAALLFGQTAQRSATGIFNAVFDQTLTPTNNQLGALRIENYFGTNTDLSAVAATAGQTSAATTIGQFFKQGELYITWSGITGSPAGCTLQPQASGDGTTFINSGTAISATPGTNAVATFSGAMGQSVKYVYACTTFPTAGTLTLKTVYK